jgi:hypothetical protein
MSRVCWQRLLFLLFVLAVAGIFLWARAMRLPLLRGPQGYVLTDPDSYMRRRLIERALAGEGVCLRWIPEDNAPYGRFNEWTAPMTILGVVTARLFQFVGRLPPERALAAATLWVGPLIGLATLATLAWLGVRAGGLKLSVLWLVAWPVLPEVIRDTQFGNCDHHGLHQWLFVATLGLCLARGKTLRAATGATLGVVNALGLWSAGSEFLPAWLTVAGLAVWEMLFREPLADSARFWRSWSIAGVTSLTAAWLFEFGPHPFHGRLEFLGVWHVSAWALTAVLLESSLRFPTVRRQRRLAVALTVLAILVIAGATRGFDWEHLHVMQDRRFQWQIMVTPEFDSFWRHGIAAGLWRSWLTYGALPLVLVWQLRQWKVFEHVSRWTCLCTGGWLILSLYHARWESFFAVALVMTIGWLLVCHAPSWKWLPLLITVVATIPCWRFVLRFQREVRSFDGNAMRGPHGATIALQAASDCLAQLHKPPIMLARWDQSGVLAGMGRVRVIGSGYWSNLDGLFAAYELLATTSPEAFWQTVETRRIEYLLVRGDDGLAGDIANAFIMIHGRRPTAQDMEATAVWQVAHDGRQTEIDCNELKRLAPTWKILQLQRP